MLAMVSEAVRVAPPPGTEMRSIPKSSVQYLHRSTRSTRNVSPLYDDDLVPYLEATNKTPDLTYLRKLKKGNNLGIGPSLLGPDAGKGLFAGSKANPAYRNSSYSGSVFKQGERIDQYKGVRVRAKETEGRFVSIQEQIIASTSKYIWQDDKDTDFAVDAEKPSSCYARYANDSLYAPLWNAELIREGDQIWLVATRDISPGEEIYVAYGEHYWKGFQDLSYDKALMAQRCYNMEAVPPYNPYAPSTAQPPQRVQHTSPPSDGPLTEETSTHTFLQVPYEIQDVASGVVSDRWNQIKKQHTDITSIQMQQMTTDMQLATLNIGGLGPSYMKITDLCYQFSAYRLDVLCLQDTRQLEKDVPFINSLIKDLLPSGTEIRHAPLQSYSGRRVGGQIIIISPKWSASITDFKKDETGLGVLTGLYLLGRSQRILILSTYWPQIRHTEPNDGAQDTEPGSPWIRISEWLRTHRPNCKYTPLEYIQTSINRWAYAHESKFSHSCQMLVGDMNAEWSLSSQRRGCHTPLSDWADGMTGWANLPLVALANSPIRSLHTQWTGKDNLARGVSWLDHILFQHSSPSVKLEGLHLVREPSTSDSHRMLISTLAVAGGARQGRLPRAPTPRKGLSRPKPKSTLTANETDLFTAAMDAYLQSHPPPESDTDLDTSPYLEEASDYLYNLCIHSAGLNLGGSTWKRKKWRTYKDGWSPSMVALQYHLQFVVDLQRHLGGSTRFPAWHGSAGLQNMFRRASEWEDQVKSLPWEDIRDASNILDKAEPDKGPSHYRLRTSLPSLYELEKTRNSLYQALHGRCRTEFRIKLCTAIKQREESRTKGKARSYLRSVLGESNSGVQLDHLCVDEQTLLTNGPEILEALTEYFKEHYSTPTRHQGPLHTDTDWMTIYTDKQKFIQATNHHNIPDSLRELIWEAMYPPNVAAAKKELESLLETPPTWEQYMETVQLKRRDTAGGMTGVTYTQISYWPEVVHRAVYKCLSDMWPSRHIPNWWKNRWLVPLAKPGLPQTPQNLRPICLVEVLRKLWMSITINRIKAVWEKHGVLDESQHGFRGERGTDSALLSIINELEKARIEHSTRLFCTYDCQRAFDSPSKNAQKLGWHTRGVPAEFAEFIVGLEEGGQTAVRTPYSADIHHRKGLEGLTDPDDLGFPGIFEAERGTPQGDVSSPTSWTALYDILLRALRLQKQRTFQEDGFFSCFADDLVSMGTSTYSIQQQADLVSAFSLIFGLDLATHKFRAYVFAFGEPLSFLNHRSIRIHGPAWIPEVVTFRTEGPVKVLGVHLDLDLSGRSQLEISRKRLRKGLEALKSCAAEAEGKLYAITSVLIPRVRYPGQFMPWTEEQIDSLDALVRSATRQILNKVCSYTNFVLHHPSLDRLPNLVEAVQKAKHQTFWRAQSRGGQQAAIANDLMARPLFQHGRSQNIHHQVTVPNTRQNWHNEYWASSLARIGSKSNLFLTRSGYQDHRSYAERPLSWLPAAAHDQLIHTGISTLGELLTLNNDSEVSWVDIGRLPGMEEYAENLQADLAEAIGPPEEVGAACLAPGQFWATDGSLGKGDAGTVIEILEIQDQGQLRVRKWSLLSMDQTWPKTSDTISWYPPDDRQGLPPTSCTRTTKPKQTEQARKVQPILQVGPRSILKSVTLGSPKRRSVYFALSHNTVNGVPATIPPRDKVSRRSLIYNSSLASEQLHHRTNRPVQIISYAALFTNILTHQPSKAVRLLMGSARTHSGSRGVKRVIQRAIPCPTPDMPPMPHENCPAAIQDLPPGPLTMFVDGSWKDEGNGIENVFLPPHIPRPSQQGGASIVFMADNPEWKTSGITTIHLHSGSVVGTNAYQMELAAMMSALCLANMAFQHQDHSHISIWTDCESVSKGLLSADWDCPSDSASTPFLITARQLYQQNAHRLTIHWQNSHPEQDKYDKRTKALKRAKKSPAEFNYQEWGNFLADIISRNEALPECFCTDDDRQRHHQYSAPMADFTMGIRPGSWFWGLDDGTPVLVDPFKTNHYFSAVQYLADRDTHNRLPGEEPRWTGMYLPLFAECWGLNSVKGSARSSAVTQAMDFRCHGGRYHKLTPDPEQADINKHCPLCYADDSQEHFFLECKYIEAEERRRKMDEDIRTLYRKLCAQHADTPALKVLAEELCSDMDRILSSGHRYLVLLGHWTEHLQGLLMDQVGATRIPSKWRHPSHYGMVKNLIVDIGVIGTRSIQDIWTMRRQAVTQLDAFMASHAADVLEHERAHVPRLPHALPPSKDAYAKLNDSARNGETAALTDHECRILTAKLLKRDPKKLWLESHKRTFSNRSGKRTLQIAPAVPPTPDPQAGLAASRHQALNGRATRPRDGPSRPAATRRRKRVRGSTTDFSPVANLMNSNNNTTSSSSSSILCVSPAIAIDVNVKVQCTAFNLNTDNNDCDLRTYNGQIMDPESRMDRRSTVFDDDFYVNPALRAVTFSSTLPLLDDNQEAAEDAFLIELARANADDTAYLHPLPSKGVG